jgi:hypothetical protein
MAEQHIPLARLERIPFDRERWTATAIERPAAVLLESGERIIILLARNSESIEGRLHLCAVQMVEVPRGLYLFVLKLLGRVLPMRLPDEYRFNAVVLGAGDDGTHVAEVAGFSLARSPAPFPVRQLTRGKYRRLIRASGRELHAAIVALFADSFPSRRLRIARPLLRAFRRLTRMHRLTPS